MRIQTNLDTCHLDMNEVHKALHNYIESKTGRTIKSGSLHISESAVTATFEPRESQWEENISCVEVAPICSEGDELHFDGGSGYVTKWGRSEVTE